jgi:hypothetical protein
MHRSVIWGYQQSNDFNFHFQTSILLDGLRNFFEHPAGQAVFEQIGMSVQGRLEEMGLRATSTPLGAR